MNKLSISRRDFLKLTLDSLLVFGGLVGLEGLIRFLSYKTEPPQPTEFDLGLAENYKLDSVTAIPEVPAALIHNDKGFTALSLVCTHLGCTVQLQTGGFVCPCHGSRFNSDGYPVKGPAVAALKPLRVEKTADGKLILHTK
ncbi:MAG: ubiquinol-cytochrome c reductase iron-sulfur subunit [Anaerolineales bacterium]|jgi:cytochrome b6-f complex iron-sulfur subunit